MKPLFLFRLFLDLLAVSLLLAAMAYYAFDNATHEVIGTAMFQLLISHNIFNRRWYGTIGKGRREARSLITKTINLSLLLTMLVLLVTSILISQTVFSFLPLTSTVTARQVHTLAAYLALLIAGLHVGLHWTMIMGVIRSKLRFTSGPTLRTYSLRAIAIAMSAYGAYGLVAHDVDSKLLLQQSFEFSDLQTPALVFAIEHMAIVALFACLAHYTVKAVQAGRGGAGSRS